MANKKLSAVIEIGGAVAGSLKSALGTTKSKMLEIGGAVQQIEKQQKALTRTIEDQARKGKNANAVTVQYAQQELALLDKKVAKLRQVQTQFRTLQNAQDANLSKRANLRGQLFDAVALGATLAAPMRAAVAFESAMADVRKVVDFDTAGEFKQMGDEVLRLSTQLPMAADGIAQIVAAGGQAGIAKNELIQFATSATKMGVAFDITADEAGQMMAEWRAAFKMSQPEVDSLADKINLLGNTTAASAPRISAIVRRVGPLGEVAGVASGEIAALGATMVGVGIQEEVASTGIQNMMLGLVVGTAATKKQQTAYDALGLSAEAVAKRMQVDARGAILSVLEAVKKLPKETQAATLSQLFGKESIKAIAPLLTVTENLVANLDKVADAQAFNGTVNKEYAARAATTANNMQLFQNRVAVLGVTLGNILLPPLNATMATIGPILTTVADLATEFPMVTQAIVMGGAALIGLKVAGIAAGYAWTFLRGAWLATQMLALRSAPVLAFLGKTVLPMVGKAVLFIGRALMANPIGLAVAAIAGAAYLIYRNWEPVKAFFGNLWADITASFNTALEWITSKIDWIGSKWNATKSFLGFGDAGAAPAQGAAASQPGGLPALPKPAMRNGAGGPVDQSTTTVTIQTQPGQDNKAIADEVMRRMKAEKGVQQRGSLYDMAGAT